MNALLVLILLGQTGGDTSVSSSIEDPSVQPAAANQVASPPAADRFGPPPVADRFGLPPASVDSSEDQDAKLPTLEPPPESRPPSRNILAADTPANRVRPNNAVANGAMQRAVVQPNASAVSQESEYSTDLLKNLLTLDEQAQPKFRKVKLVEVVAQSMDAQSQATAIGAYWELAMHIARLRFAQDKVELLSLVQAPNDAAERAVLEAALASAEVSEAAAQDELLAAQYRLVRTATISSSELLPWPADIPLVGPYRTNYETFFAQRTAPLEIKHIHQSLPGKLKLIERCYTAVSTAEVAREKIGENVKLGRSNVTSLLESADRLERARSAFLTAVVDYNDRIAEYSLAAVGPSIGPETLVTTLIKAPVAAATVAAGPRGVRQANGETAPAAPVSGFQR